MMGHCATWTLNMYVMITYIIEIMKLGHSRKPLPFYIQIIIMGNNLNLIFIASYCWLSFQKKDNKIELFSSSFQHSIVGEEYEFMSSNKVKFY